MKRKVLDRKEWKPVALDANLAARGVTEGLLGIEELTDYSLINLSRRGRLKTTSFKAKPTIVGDEDEDEEDELIQEPPKKKKKKKKKKRKNKKNKVLEKPTDVDEGELLEFENDCEVLETADEIYNNEALEVEEMKNWQDLFVPKPILRALYEQGFTTPTPIQKLTLPAAIRGRMDVIGAAETGSGKTLAFAIPILNGILRDIQREEEKEEMEVDVNESDDVEFDSGRPLWALILTPTRELAIQVKNHIRTAAKYTGINVAVVVGGMASQKQIRLLSRGPEIVVATPGRLWDLIQEGNPHLNKVKDVKYLVVDETDRMVEKGHFQELQQLLELINDDEEKRKLRQTFIFSATLSMVHEAPKKHKKSKKNLTVDEKLAEVIKMIGLKGKPKIVDITRKVGTAETLTESRIHCGLTEKDFYLYYFFQQHQGRTLVFCNSIDCVRRLVNLFGLLMCEPMGLHAQMHQKQRLKNLERFSDNDRGILIATDVAARGLDIPNVEHVVHYQVPRTSEGYVHRSGRTARASKEGLSLMLIEPTETVLYKRMCRTLNREEDIPLFPVDSGIFSGVKERVTLARELDKLMLALRKEEVSKSWWKKAAEEAELEYSDSCEDEDENMCNSMRVSVDKIKIEAKKRELHKLLASPLTDTGFSGKYPTKSGKLQIPTELKGSALKTMKEEGLAIKKLLKSRPKKTINKFKKRKKSGLNKE